MQPAARRRLKRRVFEGILELIVLAGISVGCFIALLILGMLIALFAGIIQ